MWTRLYDSQCAAAISLGRIENDDFQNFKKKETGKKKMEKNVINQKIY